MFILTGDSGRGSAAAAELATGGQGEGTWRDIYTGDMRLTSEQLHELIEEHIKSQVTDPLTICSLSVTIVVH